MYYDPTMTSMDPAIMAMLGILWFFSLVIGIVSYVFMGIGLMKMAQKAGLPNPWLSWIPGGNVWLIGELITEKLKGNGGLKALGIILGGCVLMFIPFLNILVALAITVFSIMMYYWLFEKYSENAVMHTILSIFVPLYISIVIFNFRNRPARY